jgi:endonuclease YncB( thermonuclease family)
MRPALSLTLAAAALALAAALYAAAPAHAARPDTDHCRAPLPARGATFAGEVRYVGDGDMICVGPGPDERTWIEVRLADFYAIELNSPGGREARDTLRRLALGKRAVCVAGARSWDRTVARCVIDGQAVGDLMRAAGQAEGGRGR